MEGCGKLQDEILLLHLLCSEESKIPKITKYFFIASFKEKTNRFNFSFCFVRKNLKNQNRINFWKEEESSSCFQEKPYFWSNFASRAGIGCPSLSMKLILRNDYSEQFALLLIGGKIYTQSSTSTETCTKKRTCEYKHPTAWGSNWFAKTMIFTNCK